MILLFDLLDGVDPKQALFIVINLIIIESLLSVDNAFMVGGFASLYSKKAKKDLIWIILGLVLLRGLMLVIADWLIALWWLVPVVGGFYFYCGVMCWQRKQQRLPLAFVILVLAIMEVQFMLGSIDSVFTAVAFTKNIYLIYIGVFIGLAGMAFMAYVIVRWVSRWTFFRQFFASFLILQCVLMLLAIVRHYFHASEFSKFLNSESFDVLLNVSILLVFVLMGLNHKFRWLRDTSSINHG